MNNLSSVSHIIESQSIHLPNLNQTLQLTIEVPTEIHKAQTVCSSEDDAKIYLLQAVKRGEVEVVRWLLTFQPNWVKLKTPSGMTLLHLAVQENHWPVVELLIHSGAKYFWHNSKGAGLLHSAVSHPLLATELLKRAPTLIEMRDEEGNTPLHYAAMMGKLETVKVLIEHKAWIEAKNKSGQTALHVAALSGHMLVTQYLLDQGANYQALDRENRLPEKLAKEQKHFELALMFVEHKEKFKKSQQTLEEHATVHSTLSNTPYHLLNKVYHSEAKDIYQQTGIEIQFEPNQNHYVWPKHSGNFGQVGLARNGETGQFVAVKEITGEGEIQASMNEGTLQKFLEGQPHLMPLFDYLHDTKNHKIYQFMLYAEFGDGQYLKKQLSLLTQPQLLLTNPLIKLKVLIHVAKSLLTATHYMHQNQIIHHDIKPDNLLIDRYGRIYLSDFGCAQTSSDTTNTVFGDIRYFSPEKLTARLANDAEQNVPSYQPKLSDAWAIGITLLEIASFLNPQTEFHPGECDLTPQHLAEKLKLDCLNEGGLFNIIKGLVTLDPKKRLSIPSALEDELFQNPIYELTEQERGKIFQKLKQMPTENSTLPKNTHPTNQLIYLIPEPPKSNDALSPVVPTPNKNYQRAIYYWKLKPAEKDLDNNNNQKASTLINVIPVKSSQSGESIYLKGLQAEKEKQPHKAIAFYEESFESGYIKAATQSGLLFLQSKDKTKAYDSFLKAAKQGHTTAMVNVALMLERGDGIAQDTRAALDWYQKLRALGVKVIGKDKEGHDILTQSKIDKLSTPLQVTYV